MSTSFVVKHVIVPETVVPGMRLGRHVRHDSRSRNYPVPVLAWDQIDSVIHERIVPILDQGEVGSCTGDMLVGALGTRPAYHGRPRRRLDQALAVKIYAAATRVDRVLGTYPSTDEGADGLAACKAATEMGLLAGYRWAFGLQAALSALQQGPVGTGVNWYTSFDEPSSDGVVTIKPRRRSRGAHEFLVRGVDTTRERVLCDNSWGDSWAAGGSFWMSWATWDRLLHEDGDVVQPVPHGQAAPTSVASTATPAMGDSDSVLWEASAAWAARRHTGDDAKVADALTDWARRKGYRLRRKR